MPKINKITVQLDDIRDILTDYTANEWSDCKVIVVAGTVHDYILKYRNTTPRGMSRTFMELYRHIRRLMKERKLSMSDCTSVEFSITSSTFTYTVNPYTGHVDWIPKRTMEPYCDVEDFSVGSTRLY